jgi:hypothetical protein
MEARRWEHRRDGRPRPDLLRRNEATNATFAKFRRKKFDWSKAVTCGHLARFHAKQMGHKVPPMPAFRSAVGARKALATMGFASMGELLASMFPTIAPAEMLLGDMAVIPSGDGFDAVFVCSGRWLFGWMGDEDGMTLLDLTNAWGSPIPDALDAPPELIGKTLGEAVQVFRL